MSVILAVIILIAVPAAYLAPAIIAHRRKRVSATAIAAANVLFGWTIIGWGLCLVWALSGDAGHRAVAV